GVAAAGVERAGGCRPSSNPAVLHQQSRARRGAPQRQARCASHPSLGGRRRRRSQNPARQSMLTSLSTRPKTAAQDLVDLLDECHQRIRRFLALAGEAAAHRGAPSSETAQACADVERYFKEALPLHVADEEESITPRLRG